MFLCKGLDHIWAGKLAEEVFIDRTGRPSSRLFSTSSTFTKHKGDRREVIYILHDIQADQHHNKTMEDLWRERER